MQLFVVDFLFLDERRICDKKFCLECKFLVCMKIDELREERSLI